MRVDVVRGRAAALVAVRHHLRDLRRAGDGHLGEAGQAEACGRLLELHVDHRVPRREQIAHLHAHKHAVLLIVARPLLAGFSCRREACQGSNASTHDVPVQAGNARSVI